MIDTILSIIGLGPLRGFKRTIAVLIGIATPFIPLQYRDIAMQVAAFLGSLGILDAHVVQPIVEARAERKIAFPVA